MERPSLKLAALCALTLCIGPAVHAANVRLLNGESYSGKTQFSNNQLVVITQSGTTRIDLPELLDAYFRDDSASAKGPVLPAGVLLANGSLVPGQVANLTDPIKLGNATIPLSSVAWVVFAPIERDKITQPSSGQTGAILPGGEFFPGVFIGIKDDRVGINSTLFGPQRFAIRGRPEIAALVLRDVQDSGARYQISARNGSVYAVNDIKTEGDSVMINDPVFGNVKISTNDLVEIHLSKSQYQYLAAMKPAHVAAPAGVDAETAVQVPQNAGDPASENVQTAVNVAVTYAVPKGFSTFSANASVGQGGPPGARFTFAVYGDGGGFITRTPAIGAGDNAQRLNINVSNLHTITLRIEPASVGATAGPAQWIQPMFLRQ